MNNKDIINVIDLKMEIQLIDEGSANCLFYVLDVDNFNIDNILFYFDVSINVPEVCKYVDVAVFGNVYNSNITSVTLSGSIQLNFVGLLPSLLISNVYSNDNDNTQNE